MTEHDDFEDRLRAGLSDRSREVIPVADVDDLGVRVGVARRKRQRMIISGVAGVAVVLFVATAAIAARDDGDPVQVGGRGIQSELASSTTTSSAPVTTTTAASDPSGGGGGSAPTTTVPPDVAQLETQIRALVATMFDADTTADQRVAMVTDGEDIRPSVEELRDHEQYGALTRLLVTVDTVEFADDYGSAEVNLDVELGDTTGTLGVAVVFADGQAHLTRQSFCFTLPFLTDFIGGPVLTCTAPPTSSTTVPSSTTTTTVPTATTTTTTAS